MSVEFEKEIETIIRDFDFDEVQKTMDALDWEWAFESAPSSNELFNLRRPSLEELKNGARRVLKKALEDNKKTILVSSGGFVALKRQNENENEICLRLMFAVEDSYVTINTGENNERNC